MKHALPTIALCLLLTPALSLAQDAPAPADPAPELETEAEDGFSLIEEGAKLLLRGMIDQMEPALEDAQKAFEGMEPALRDLLAKIDDIRNYDAPEVLANGDILIRRKAGAPPPALLTPTPPEPPPPPAAGEIDL